uniref:Uncharacterized protein n=1 Tax=Triticum urartu TaxID=4572 RepID=A0A8R7UHI9_TRIUA
MIWASLFTTYFFLLSLQRRLPLPLPPSCLIPLPPSSSHSGKRPLPWWSEPPRRRRLGFHQERGRLGFVKLGSFRVPSRTAHLGFRQAPSSSASSRRCFNQEEEKARLVMCRTETLPASKMELCPIAP